MVVPIGDRVVSAQTWDVLGRGVGDALGAGAGAALGPGMVLPGGDNSLPASLPVSLPTHEPASLPVSLPTHDPSSVPVSLPTHDPLSLSVLLPLTEPASCARESEFALKTRPRESQQQCHRYIRQPVKR